MNALAIEATETMPAIHCRFLKIGADGQPLPRDASDWAAVHEPARALMWTAADAVDEDVNYDEAQAAIDALNAQAFAGFSDWRLPTVDELYALADRSRFSPAIDTEFFPTTKIDWYWTSTPLAASPSDCAWVVYFGDGNVLNGNRDYDHRVRAVRGSARRRRPPSEASATVWRGSV